MTATVQTTNPNRLVSNFAEQVPGVQDVIMVSSDGLPIAVSSGLDRDSAEAFSAVASGLIGLAYGAAGLFGGGAVQEVMIEAENGFLFVTGVSNGSCLSVVADPDCDVGLVAYEMALLVESVGDVIRIEGQHQ